MEVFIKVTVVLATYIEEDNVLLRVFQVCFANSCDVSRWTAHTVDQLLSEGNTMYLKAFQKQTIPDTETI